MLNWAIVGSGTISDSRIAPALNRSNTNSLYAIVSRNKEKASQFAQKHNVKKIFLTLEEMLQDPSIDVVYLGSPNAIHSEQAIACCKAKKQVFCEKPMALTVEECEAMIKAAKENGVKLGVAFNNRYNPIHVEIKKRLDENLIGDISFASAVYGVKGNRYDWRLNGELSGGGAIMDVGVHAIDLLRFLLGREVVEVAATLDTVNYGWPLDEHVSAILKFEGGINGLLIASAKMPYAKNGISFYGTEGSIFGNNTLKSMFASRLHSPIAQLEIITKDRRVIETFEEIDTYQKELDSFGEAIIANRQPDITGLDGLKTQEVVLAIQKSEKTGERVKIGQL